MTHALEVSCAMAIKQDAASGARKNGWRVDNVRGLRWLAVEMYAVVTAAVLHTLLVLFRVTLRFRVVGLPADHATAPYLETAWHHHIPAYFLAAMPCRKPHAWMNHPAWYMRPVHVLMAWNGVSAVALGSSGNGGRAALEDAVTHIRAGASTFVSPDGPYGPQGVLKDGVLDMAMATGVPVLPMAFRFQRSFRLPTWDRKHIPWPFSRVDVLYGSPVSVTPQARTQARDAVVAALNAGEPPLANSS